MDRMELSLATERNNYPIIMKEWKYLFVGVCTGDVTIRLGSTSGSELDPNEFDKLTEIYEYQHLYITNSVQTGKKLVLYYEEVGVTDVE